VKQTIAEDITRIRESVQAMISEALIKREAKKKSKAGDFSSDGFAGGNNSGVEGGSASKAKSESEKI
jgi:hypothetical protein